MAAAAAVVTVDALASTRPRAGHTRTTRGADGQASQQCRPVDDARRRYSWTVQGEPPLDLLEQVQRQDGRDSDFHYRGRIMQGASPAAPNAVSPLAGSVAGALED